MLILVTEVISATAPKSSLFAPTPAELPAVIHDKVKVKSAQEVRPVNGSFSFAYDKIVGPLRNLLQGQ